MNLALLQCTCIKYTTLHCYQSIKFSNFYILKPPIALNGFMKLSPEMLFRVLQKCLTQWNIQYKPMRLEKLTKILYSVGSTYRELRCIIIDSQCGLCFLFMEAFKWSWTFCRTCRRVFKEILQMTFVKCPFQQRQIRPKCMINIVFTDQQVKKLRGLRSRQKGDQTMRQRLPIQKPGNAFCNRCLTWPLR